MISISKINRINEIKKKIESKYRIIKELNFNKDINVEKSDRFCIDSNPEGLRFLYKEIRALKPQDYSLITGKTNVINGGVELIPTLNDMTDNKVKRSHIIMNESFKLNGADFIQVEAVIENKNNLFISIDNKYSRGLYERQRKHDIFLSGNEFDTPMRKTFTYQLGTGFVARKYEGLSEKQKTTISINRGENVNIGINLGKGYMIMRGKKRPLPPVDFDKQEELYASLVFNSEIDENENKRALISSMKLAAEKGFIYFNPCEIQASGAQIFMVYRGTPEVQYFSTPHNKWLGIMEGQQLLVKDLSQMRIRMVSWDCIYKFMITRKDDL